MLNRTLLASVLVAGASLITSGLAMATTTASSSAFGEYVNLTVNGPTGAPLINIVSGPLPSVASTAPPSSNNSDSLASVTVSSLLTGDILAARLLGVNATASIGPLEASASAILSALNLNLLGLLTVGADTLSSTAHVDSSLNATGSTSLVNASLAGPLSAGLSISATPAPNTVLLNIAGLEVVLNEQILGGNGLDSRSITVNGMHVYFNALAVPILGLGNTLTGEIILSHVEASVVNTVPEPTSLLLLASGLTGLALWQRKRANLA